MFHDIVMWSQARWEFVVPVGLGVLLFLGKWILSGRLKFVDIPDRVCGLSAEMSIIGFSLFLGLGFIRPESALLEGLDLSAREDLQCFCISVVLSLVLLICLCFVAMVCSRWSARQLRKRAHRSYLKYFACWFAGGGCGYLGLCFAFAMT